MSVKLEDWIVTKSSVCGKRVSIPRLNPGRRPDTGVDEWLAAMVRGLDALEFLERSRELAAESVVGSGHRVLGTPTSPIDES